MYLAHSLTDTACHAVPRPSIPAPLLYSDWHPGAAWLHKVTPNHACV
jgi:hypothetical protein